VGVFDLAAGQGVAAAGLDHPRLIPHLDRGAGVAYRLVEMCFAELLTNDRERRADDPALAAELVTLHAVGRVGIAEDLLTRSGVAAKQGELRNSWQGLTILGPQRLRACRQREGCRGAAWLRFDPGLGHITDRHRLHLQPPGD